RLQARRHILAHGNELSDAARTVDVPLIDSKINTRGVGSTKYTIGCGPAALIDDPQDAIRGVDEHAVTIDEGRTPSPRSRGDLHCVRHHLARRHRTRIPSGMAVYSGTAIGPHPNGGEWLD